MTDSPDNSSSRLGAQAKVQQPDVLAEQINEALKVYSDKDWNYSRISLVLSTLEKHTSPYILWIEVLDLTTKGGLSQLKTLIDEVKWGDRHSSELGILELVSLRINKALLDATSHDYWKQKQPVVRIARLESPTEQGIRQTLWYQITEVAGEDFDSR